MEAKRTAPPLLASRDQVPATARSLLSSTWTLGVLVFLATWGGGVVSPYLPPAIDSSAHAGLQMAAVRGFDFGSDIVFTYGPLGFLKSYVVFEVWPARLATLYGLGLHLALSLSLVWVARRHLPLALAVVFAYVGAALMRGDLSAFEVRDDAGVVVLALIWCVAALSADRPRWTRRLVVYGGGPFAALEILGKLNTGVLVLALVTITVAAIEEHRWRNVAILAAGFTASLTALWFAAGQSVANFDDFIVSAFQITSGYSSGAVFTYLDQREYDYVLGPLLIVATGAVAWIATMRLPAQRRVASLALFAISAFTAWKAGFVAHEPYHMASFFGMIVGIGLAFTCGLSENPKLRIGAAAVIAVTIGAGMTDTFPRFPISTEGEPGYAVWTPNPIATAVDGVETLATIVKPGALATQIAEDRERLRDRYAIDAESLALLRGHSVHVDPQEAAAVWAHQLDWRPLPSFQSYAAWTPDLDEQNAEALASTGGPERILRQNLNALGRFPGYESPAAMLAMLCHYEPLHSTDSWQVLGRAGDRCGDPRPLGTAQGPYGSPIPVPEPPPGSVVFARVRGIQVSGVERLTAFLERAKEREVSFETVTGAPASALHSPPGHGRFVFLPATAEGGLVLRVPARLDFPGPFGIAPDAKTVTFWREHKPADGRLSVNFFAMPMTPFAGTGGD